METIIIELEERLRLAMLHSNIDELDILISEKLLFTNHLGQLLSKDDDLKAHRNKTFVFSSIHLSGSNIVMLNDSAVVSVKADIKGFYQGEPANGNFRFTRCWTGQAGSWQIVAGHSSLIQA